MSTKIVGTALDVVWPISKTTSLFEAIHQIRTIMSAQHPEGDIVIHSIYVGDPEFAKLTFDDAGNKVYLNYCHEPEMVKPGHIKIYFVLKSK